MRYIGVDPGVSGGIAWIDGDGVNAVKMPETESEILELFFKLALNTECKGLIELVHSMPLMGRKSMFTFGKSYGFLRACIIGSRIPLDEVSPMKWQRALGCLTKGDKNISKAKGQNLFPTLKLTHATADAILIAEYLRRRESGQLNQSLASGSSSGIATSLLTLERI